MSTTGLTDLPAYDAVVGRRSIRRFLSTPVPEDIVRQILHAAALPPDSDSRYHFRTVSLNSISY